MFHLLNFDSDQNMDSSDFPATRSPRRELQGPRPPALKVNKDSHKIKKPPIAPQPPPHQSQNHRQQHPPRPPVIIYDVSPKVIHTQPKDFMDLVQRLTGPSSSSAANPFTHDGGAISPAARYAAVERAKPPKEKMMMMPQQQQDFGNLVGIEQVIERSSGNTFPGILSPGPASLPAISPNFISPASDPNWLSFLHDLSPAVNGNNFMASPSTFVPSRFTSPTSFDLFNNLFDF